MEKFYYKARIQYDGTNHSGFQWQVGMPTIQDDFTQALIKLAGGQISTMGSSRTDSGVHAREQYVKITSENEITGDVNVYLPPEIRCLSIEACDGKWRPNVSAKKEYRYLFTNVAKETFSDRHFIANNPYPLNIEAMKVCVAAIVGVHSFHNFVSTGSNVDSTVRTVTFCELSVVNPQELFSGTIFVTDVVECFQLRIEASGFLKHMIRHLMTALWKVGSGRLSVEEFTSLLDGPKREGMLWKVAHPKGLILWRIQY